MTEQKITVNFAPGAFDDFEGTQEELDQLIAEITRMVESGEIFEKSQPVDLESLMDEETEWAEKILNSADTDKRILQ
jgi:hypothetical protein